LITASSKPPILKTPLRKVQRGPLAAQIELNLQQRAAMLGGPLLDLQTVRLALGGISYSRLNKLVEDGSLKVFRIGRGHRKVRQSVLQALLAKGDQR
jgi:hypothetical protein